MSPTRGRHIVRQAPPKRLERPSFDRPSLFAGMEAGDSIVPEDDDLSRGGILSTLESVRQRKPLRAAAHPGPAAESGLWQNRILWGVLGAGVVALLGSFAMIVNEGHSRSMAAQEAAIEHAVLSRTPAPVPQETHDLNVLSAPAAGGLASAVVASAAPVAPATTAATIVDAGLAQPGPAIAGVVSPPALKAAAVVVSPVPPMPAVDPIPAAQPAPPEAKATAPSTPSAAPQFAAQVAPKGPDKALAIAQDKARDKPQDKQTARRISRKQPDEDVALLEAMFHHTQGHVGAPAAGPSVAEQLQNNCGKLSGASAATCRARICVSNPSAAVCHDTP